MVAGIGSTPGEANGKPLAARMQDSRSYSEQFADIQKTGGGEHLCVKPAAQSNSPFHMLPGPLPSALLTLLLTPLPTCMISVFRGPILMEEPLPQAQQGGSGKGAWCKAGALL
jgi:hypothetical protein